MKSFNIELLKYETHLPQNVTEKKKMGVHGQHALTDPSSVHFAHERQSWTLKTKALCST